MSNDNDRSSPRPNTVPQQVVDASAPYRLPRDWPRFRTRSDCRRWRRNSTDRLRELCDQSQLQAAGLVDDTGQWHPNFPTPGVPLLAIQRKENGPVTEVITAAGCLRRRQLPLVALLDDWYVQKLLPGLGGRMLLTGDLEDTLLLRYLGLPSAPAIGLTSAGRAELDLLKSTFAWKPERERPDDGRAGSERSSEEGSTRIRPSHLTLVGFSVRRLEGPLPETLEPVVAFLTGVVETIGGLNLTGVSVLEPDRATLERLRDAIRLQGATGGRQMLVELLESNSYSLLGYRRLRQANDEPAPDYQAARAALRQVSEATSAGLASVQQQQRAWKGFAAAVDRDVVGPLLENAEEAADPADRARLLAAAELARTMLLLAPDAEAACRDASINSTAGPSEVSKRIAAFGKVAGQLSQVLKELL